jgi:hypothetical protein
MAIEYVAYTNGLGIDDDHDEGFAVGDVVTKERFTDEDWAYHIQHGNVVRKGGPHDPEVLAAALAPEEDLEDPKEQRIRELERQLDLLTGRVGTPAPGQHLVDVQGLHDEDLDIVDAEQMQTTPVGPPEATPARVAPGFKPGEPITPANDPVLAKPAQKSDETKTTTTTTTGTKTQSKSDK